MKKLSLSLAIILTTLISFGQCYPDRHNTSWFNGWLSCESSVNPNNLRGDGHWISYDFGAPYELNVLKLWNVNDPDFLQDGAKNITIDYSIDGINWINFGSATVPQAPGISIYEGDNILDFGGIKARYLLLTVIDNYGGDCYGFSEMRIGVNPSKNENEDVCILADVYPNPFSNDFSVFLKKKCLGDVFLAVEDATGRTVLNEEIIQLNDTRLINAKSWSPGVYYVCLRNGDILERYKVVKL